MSGDCGHGWGYHHDGPSGPCYACERDETRKLRAELEALRADAERYRWLRDRYTVTLLNGECEFRITSGPRAGNKAGIDAAIDEARKGAA